MEAIPPSYSSTVSRDPWSVIAPYLDTPSLLAAVLVCKAWHVTLIPHLWGNPSLHSSAHARDGFRNPNSSLIRFISVLPRVRPWIRDLSHTIRMPPTVADVDYSSSSNWIRVLLKALPHLQALDLPACKSVDHLALCELNGLPENNVRLLNLSGCPNATPTGLATGLAALPQLLYLDLSRISSARSPPVVAAYAKLTRLRVLRLSSVGLDDDTLLAIGTSLPPTLLSLDLSSNPRLTSDTFVRLRMTGHGPWSVSPLPRALFPPDLAGATYKALTEGPTDSLLVEDAPPGGLIQLNLSGSAIGLDAAFSLAAQSPWTSLDVGDLLPTRPQRTPFTFPADAPLSGLVHLRCPLSLVRHLSSHLSRFPKLERLAITNIPATAPNDAPATNLTTLIRAAADVEHQSSLARRFSATSTAALKSITLEVLEPATSVPATSPSLSVTEDADSDSMWTTASQDFSFFGNAIPTTDDTGLIRTGSSASDPGACDIVQFLAGFRRTVKAEAEKSGHWVEGYWPGRVRVVRR